MVSVLCFNRMTRVVSTLPQLDTLLTEAHTVGLPKGLTILVVGDLVASRYHSYKRTTDFCYLVSQSRKLEVSFILLTSSATRLDRRIESQLMQTLVLAEVVT